MNGTNFTIIGVLEEQGDDMMGSGDEVAFIPFATGQRLMDSIDITTVYFGAETSEDVDTAKASLEAYLLDLSGGDEDEYTIFANVRNAGYAE